MARVKEVIQRDMPAGPGDYGSQEGALTAEPHRPIVDGQFPTREKAKNAAYRVNDGEAKRWPKERYFAIFALNPEPRGEIDSDGNFSDAWEVLIAPRSHGIPDAWVKEVNAPGSRRKNREASTEDGSFDGDPAEDEPENEDSEPVGQEIREPVSV
jgi:hypothetical protein